jgi:hypothetical protein
MQVHKLRAKADGLAPVGAYFATIAAKLEEMSAHEAARRDELEEEDRALEAVYRKRSRTPAVQETEPHAMM